MRYQTADYIRSFVMALSVEGHDINVGCACVQRNNPKDEWEVHLFDRNDTTAHFLDYVVLAKAITAVCPCLTIYEGRYNFALHGVDYVPSIVIW